MLIIARRRGTDARSRIRLKDVCRIGFEDDDIRMMRKSQTLQRTNNQKRIAEFKRHIAHIGAITASAAKEARTVNPYFRRKFISLMVLPA